MSIRLHLADYPAYNPKDPEATMLCNLPDARGSTVSTSLAQWPCCNSLQACYAVPLLISLRGAMCATQACPCQL